IYALTGTAPDTVPEAQMMVMRLIVPFIIMCVAMLVGAVYSWIAGYLKVKLNVNELISTIILNEIAVKFVSYMVNQPLRADFNNTARTRTIDDSAWLIPFNRGLLTELEWFSGARVGIGILIALVAAVLIWF